ncbi:MAG TPA: lipoprotein-releasing system transmembrane subunit LolC [Hyphomonadaceae bacterium]|nr:lipoprotein-releasing system transmembrane subunit LolC [Hyphomonadaceae bacterium]
MSVEASAARTPLAGAFGGFERQMAWRYLRARRKQGGVALIASIAFLAVMASVAVLVIVMSVMNGFRSEFIARVLGVGGHVFVTTAGFSPSEASAARDQIALLPDVVSIAPLIEGQAFATVRQGGTGALVRGVRREDLERAAFRAVDERGPGVACPLPAPTAGDAVGCFTEGGLYRFEEGAEAIPRVMIGYRLAQSLGVRAGEQVTLLTAQGATTAFGVAPRRKSYEIAGVFDFGHALYDQSLVYLPLDEAKLYFNRGDSIDNFEIRVRDPDDLTLVKRQIAEIVGGSFLVLDWRDQNDTIVNALAVERMVMRLILMLVVSIAALNIVSALVMLVRNKSRDIAIMRSMGAERGTILRIFMLAGAAIGVGGALAGAILGVVFCLNIGPIQDFVARVTGADVFNSEVYFLSRLPAKIEYWEVALVSGWSMFMAFLASLPQAWRAARLDPVEVLRFD